MRRGLGLEEGVRRESRLVETLSVQLDRQPALANRDLALPPPSLDRLLVNHKLPSSTCSIPLAAGGTGASGGSSGPVLQVYSGTNHHIGHKSSDPDAPPSLFLSSSSFLSSPSPLPFFFLELFTSPSFPHRRRGCHSFLCVLIVFLLFEPFFQIEEDLESSFVLSFVRSFS